MSEYVPVVGDRVRVVLEGEVTYVGGGEFDLASAARVGDIHKTYGTYINPNGPGVISVEKITPPLPTTPGSVVVADGVHRMLGDDGRWYATSGGRGLDAAQTLSCGYRPIFDAGAS